MFDPEVVKVEITVWLDGPMGRHQIGWAVYDGSDREVVEMEVQRSAPLDDVVDAVLGVAAPLLQRHRARVAPF